MVDPSDNLNLDETGDLPAALRADLRDHYSSVPPQAITRVDDAIRAAARTHFPHREEVAVLATLGPRNPRRWAWKLGALAAAAAIAIVIFINPFADKGPRNFQGPVAAYKDSKNPIITGDVNLDGRVDILDAYLLQRELEGGPATAIGLWEDLTGDHKLDQQDVNALAAAAVKLGGPRL